MLSVPVVGIKTRDKHTQNLPKSITYWKLKKNINGLRYEKREALSSDRNYGKKRERNDTV